MRRPSLPVKTMRALCGRHFLQVGRYVELDNVLQEEGTVGRVAGSPGTTLIRSAGPGTGLRMHPTGSESGQDLGHICPMRTAK